MAQLAEWKLHVWESSVSLSLHSSQHRTGGRLVIAGFAPVAPLPPKQATGQEGITSLVEGVVDQKICW